MILKLLSGRQDNSGYLEVCTETSTIKNIDWTGEVSWHKPITECYWRSTSIQSLDHFFELTQEDGYPQWKEEAARYYDSLFLDE